MTQEVAARLMVSLVLSRMDYCNCLLTGIPDYLVQKLQLVQNFAAKVCFRAKKFDHVTEILKALHWLPVQQRIDYKIATICHKCFYGGAPDYLKELIIKKTNSRSLRSSSDTTILIKPRKSLKTYGERSFEFYAPLVWNSLPKRLRELNNITLFKKQLKHHLFVEAYK